MGLETTPTKLPEAAATVPDEAANATDAAGAGGVANWALLALRLLSVMEKLLPTFLMAWADSLRQKNRELEGKLLLNDTDKAIEGEQNAIKAKAAGEAPGATIDRFLSK